MPEFRKGVGVWTKLCEQCGKPFTKTARVQKHCLDCKAANLKRRGKNAC